MIVRAPVARSQCVTMCVVPVDPSGQSAIFIEAKSNQHAPGECGRRGVKTGVLHLPAHMQCCEDAWCDCPLRSPDDELRDRAVTLMQLDGHDDDGSGRRGRSYVAVALCHHCNAFLNRISYGLDFHHL